MRKLTLNTAAVALEINGEVYELLLSDAEIMALAAELGEKTKNVNASDAAQVLAASREVAGAIDRMLGEGAVARISGGKPVGIRELIRWFRLINDEAMKAYFDKLVAAND